MNSDSTKNLIRVLRTLISVIHFLRRCGTIYRARFRRDIFWTFKYPDIWDRFLFSNKSEYTPGSLTESRVRNLTTTIEIIEALGLTYSWVPIEKKSHSKTRLSLNINDREKFITGLRALPQGREIRCLPGDYMARIQAVPTHKGFSQFVKKENIRRLLFFYPCKTSWLTETSISAGCEVEFFECRDGMNHLVRSNDISRLIPENDEVGTIVWNKLKIRCWNTFSQNQSLDTPDFDIDLVYTWVDGNDIEWRAEKNSWQNETYHSEATDDGRFTCRNELKFSLRSIAFLADFFKNIYIVTNGQIPSWLNTDHPKIKLITHKEIFRSPDTALPTFNSHAIESNLHRIEGLSEHYLYLNDDCIFLGRMEKTNFFTFSGKPKIFINKNNNFGLVQTDDSATPYVNAGRNTVRLLYKFTGKVFSSSISHTPHSELKSACNELEELIETELSNTEHQKFRTKNDISLASSLGPAYCLATGKGVEGWINSATVGLSGNIDMKLRLLTLLALQDKEFVCLNEGTKLDPPTQEKVERYINLFLNLSFPHPSEYER